MSLLRRPGLLLSAAVTLTVPGVLAALAVLGHEHAAFEARSEAVSLGSSAPPASMPVESLSAAAVPAKPAAGSAAIQKVAAEMEKISGVHAAAFGAAVNPQQALGMRLLSKSAAAGLTTSYQGVELIAQSGVDGAVTMISDVWHQGRGLTVTQTSDAGMVSSSQPYVSYDVDNHSPEGVFGVTKTLVALLGKHYAAAYRGTGVALGRPALVVELDRANGSLAARFWLDRQTLVPLRRDVYDTSARLVSEDAFVQVQFGALTAPPAGAAAASASAPARSAWSKVTVPASLLAQVNGQGWRLPGALPGGLSLYAAAQGKTSAGEVADLGYSDGLSVISLFVQRGTLAPKMSGWQAVNVSGHLVYVAGHSITWAGRGLVYTMIADAPPQTVQAVVAALPGNTAPGFLVRIGRGLDRLATLVNPFR
ncbi:MAG TPA: sigma-E factor regulatory protein RseB domain-containing protein [Trebonia sp.]|nr:sigma-E factor regulatory protein RseB domain-containing protein [Trebonia sp.]